MKRPLRCLLRWHAWHLTAFDNDTQLATFVCRRCDAQRVSPVNRQTIQPPDYFSE